KNKEGVSLEMRKNEYTTLEQFTSQYVGEWNPSENHWLGLDFISEGIQYRFHTGLMYEREAFLPDGREIMFGLYRKKTYLSRDRKEFELLGEYAEMCDVLNSTVIQGRAFRDVIMDENTELIGQD
ncbi:MAG: hypothetical protein MJ097_05980, partial [Dorea sp.]|nr:hypothetical protein [Dorea sp.]